ncbi:MAG: hypothetical protein MI807_23970 [Verrucomicrobiales bacterium]|nr:hypothetical protein [Verrucomicrobiales bacterium]
MRLLLEHLGVLSAEELASTGHAAPHWLAAGVLRGGRKLSWLEMWHVLRWYAHNRGYDGNRRWAGDDDTEDTEKEANAIRMMEQHGTDSMAETVCAVLGVDPDGKKFSSSVAFKTRNAAFPREAVVREVRRLLEAHINVLPNLNQDFIDTLIEPEESHAKPVPAWKTIAVPDIHLPERYRGGLLFGQLTPRFDNRTINKCRITGKNPPNKHSIDFLRYRWARLVANIRVDGVTLSAEARQALTCEMEAKGNLTVSELEKAVTKITGSGPENTNLEAMFKIHPDSKDALVIDPALALFHGRGPGSKNLKPYWEPLPEIVRERALQRWKKRRPVSLAWMLSEIKNSDKDLTRLSQVIDEAYDKDQAKPYPKFVNREKFLHQSFAPKQLTGRAPYSRETMQEVWREIIDNGWDSTKPCRATKPDTGEDKRQDGILYTSREMRDKERDRNLAELTNNHLIRHRLQILEEKLLPDLVAEYCSGEAEAITDVVVEVNRDLRDFSGMTQKEIAAEMNSRMRDFKSAVKYLEKYAPGLKLNGTLIRKARIAMDLGWRCPFTAKKYGPESLRELTLEHIIPFSMRRTNALHALVLTWPSVNDWKAKRTGLEFIEAEGGKSVPGDDTLSILSRKQYEQLVDGLDTKGHADDRRRKWNRKAALLVENYEPTESSADFTDGMLTQTSQLVRLACRRIEKGFPHLVADAETDVERRKVYSIPGRVTGEVRKAWNLVGTLARVCPEVLDEDGTVLPKDDIRSLTHLHHALDAIVLGLTSHLIPRNGRIWQLVVKRRLNESEQAELKAKCPIVQFGTNGSFGLQDLPKELKENITQALDESRAVQHIPSDRSGAKAELNPWRVVDVRDGEAVLMQRESFSISSEDDDAKRVWEKKKITSTTAKLLDSVSKHLRKDQINAVKRGKLKLKKEKVEKILGLYPEDGEGKLKRLQAVLILGENYGLALDPKPCVIPHHKVSERLERLRKENLGNSVRVLRKGMLIRIERNPPRVSQDYTGIWQIVSIKNNSTGPAVDMVRPGYITGKNGVDWAGMNKKVEPLINAGLEIVDANYTGLPKSISK